MPYAVDNLRSPKVLRIRCLRSLGSAIYFPLPLSYHHNTYISSKDLCTTTSCIKMAADAPRKCSGGDCENDAGSLQCPNCQKLGKESYFCSQDCFKRNWV